MTIWTDKQEQVLMDYLHSYKECFEALNDLLVSIVSRIELTEEEIKLAEISEMKYKNMVYHLRKLNPKFKRK